MTVLTLAPGLVSKAYDTDGNGILNDNLKIAKNVQTILDTDKNGSVDVVELSKGIEDDKEIIRSGEVFARKGELKMSGGPEMLNSFNAINAELYKVQEPLDKFKTAEKEYPALSPKANSELNSSKANYSKYAQKALNVANEMMIYARTAPIVTQQKADAYQNLLNTTDQIAQTYKAQANFLEPKVKVMNEAISLNPTATILDIARKSYELSVSVSTEIPAKSKTATVGKISEAKIQIAKLEIDKMTPQVQNINAKITQAAPNFGQIKGYIR
jgi:hypothetical protein